MGKLDDFIEAQKQQHEYTLMELRLMGEDIKAEFCEKLDKKIEPVNTRLTSLEHSRTRFKGILTGLSLAWGGVTAYLTHRFWK